MATRTSACLPWRRLGYVGAVWLTFALCPGHVLRAAESDFSNPPSSNPIVVTLDYQETDYSVNNCNVSLTVQTVPFKKEPAAASGRIIRGVFNFGGDSRDATPFLWQRDAGKLYLDLNRNRDLTDDPGGVFVAPAARPAYSQVFTNIHLVFNTASGSRRALVDITLWDYGSQPMCFRAARSFWQCKLTLQGRDWQAGIVQNSLNPSDSFENSRLLLRPWEKRHQPFNAEGGSLVCVPFSRKLFLEGRAYQLETMTRSQNGEARPALKFTEQSVALGAVNVTGQFIRRLVLPDGPYLAVLDRPAGVMKIPTGSYGQPSIELEHNGAEAFCTPGPFQTGETLTVDGKTPAALKVGGPLTNSVAASRRGQDLRLDYNLVGAGGEIYQLATQDRSKPPEFAIYKGARKIASGTFEFG